MYIEKLKSKNYRVRKTINGYRLSFTFDHKPTKKEIEAKVKEYQEPIYNEFRTFKECALSYIDVKSNILSPTTLYSYSHMINQIPTQFLKKPLYQIKPFDIQFTLNTMTKTRSPKTIRNVFSFIRAVIKIHNPNFIFNTITLPQLQYHEPYIPTDDDIKKIYKFIKDTEEEVPFLLACLGMRRGEIMALTMADIQDGVIIINKSMVQIDKKKIIKTPKTLKSNRHLLVPSWLTDKIKTKGYIYKGHIQKLTKVLERIQVANNLPRFSMHKLRHYFASTNHDLGVPAIYTKSQGGWSSDRVLNAVYTHSINSEYDTIIKSHFDSVFQEKCPTNIPRDFTSNKIAL